MTHVTEMCGARGTAWFEALPGVVSDLEQQWGIRVGRPFPGIEYNFVAEAVRDDGVPVVVKIAPPFETVEIFGEAKYLRLHDGTGAVRLLAENRERHAILLERAIPGEALHHCFNSNPIASIGPAIDVLKRILQPPPSDMTDVPTLDDWFDGFRSYRDTDFPADFAERALNIYDRLSSQRKFYIHGDYHPANIVSAALGDFQIIDPKGIVGSVCYDIAVFLINLERWQRKNTALNALLDSAVSAFASAFDFTEQEVREWVFAQMVIGAWWNYQDMPELYDAELAMPAIWHL
ncbi:MAG: aminoglycoside phosphotransferase family protein [Pyrinomonadaceae bacterium]